MSVSLAVLQAIVIGYNGAPAPDLPVLRYADDDAASYARLFEDAGARVTLLTEYDGDSRALHAERRPDGPPTIEALRQAVRRVPAGAEVFLVYAGHGDIGDGEGFVQLRGGRLTRSALANDVLTPLKGSRVHVIVDACKSYFLVFDRGPGGARTPFAGHFLEGHAPKAFPNVGYVLSTSTAADSHEWEAFQAGLFSHEVRSALRGAADADGDARISYAELGAFVRQANRSVPNPRFRPRFLVVPPSDSRAGFDTSILAWSAAYARRLIVPGSLGRLAVDDRRGVRILDAHPGGATTLALYLPPGGAFVQVGDAEYEIPADRRLDLRVDELSPGPPELAPRGALHEAFRRLFELPFDGTSVAAFKRSPRGDGGDEGSALRVNSHRAFTRRVAGIVAIGALVVGGGLTATAYATARAARDDAAQADRVRANQRIDLLNIGAIAAYAVAGAAGSTWLVLQLLPDGAAVGVGMPLP